MIKREKSNHKKSFLKDKRNLLGGFFKGMRCSLSCVPSVASAFAVTTLLFPLSSLLLLSCGTGDDDGARLAEQIVGTWYRGWAEGDVEIIGDVKVKPEDFSYHYFTFKGDGSYNGMVRDGSFSAIDTFGDTIYAGTYKCDNDNLRLEYTNSGQKQKIQARVLSFDQLAIRLEYKNADAETPVTVRLKLSATPTTKPSPMD